MDSRIAALLERFKQLEERASPRLLDAAASRQDAIDVLQRSFVEFMEPLNVSNAENLPYLLQTPSFLANAAKNESPMITENDGEDTAAKENDDAEDNNDIDDTEASKSSDEELLSDTAAAEYVVVVGKLHIYIWEYLGHEWSDRINAIQNVPPLSNMSSRICADLHKYQLTGVNKMLFMANSFTRGCILGDEMGLGKTLESIVTGVHLLEQHGGGMNVVVAPKSCIVQWEEALYTNVHPRPRVKVLDDPRTTAHELLAGQYEWILCSYHFVRSRHREIMKYKAAMDDLKPRTVENARNHPFFKIHKKYLSQRPVAALFSEIYAALGDHIRCLFLDEGHFIKDEASATYKAVSAIPALYRFVLTGTIFANRWHDVFAPVSLLNGHAFHTRLAFQKAFADRKEGDSVRSDPSVTKENRLVKFLMGVFVARPASVLPMPELTFHERRSGPLSADHTGLISYLVLQFYECLRRAGDSSPVELLSGGSHNKNSNMWTEQAIYSMNLAQIVAGNVHMLRPQDRDVLHRMKVKAAALSDKFVSMFKAHEVGSESYHQAIMDYIQQRKGTEKGSEVDGTTRTQILKVNTTYDDVSEYESDEESSAASEADNEVGSVDEELLVAPREHCEATNMEVERAATTRAVPTQWHSKLASMSHEEMMSRRVSAVIETVREIRIGSEERKVLVFSRYRKFLDIVERALGLEMADMVVMYRFDGTVSPQSRPGVVNDFAANDEQGRTKIMLITAGFVGAGMDLAAASHVVLCEPWWRNADERQAIARAYRQKQTHQVHVWRVLLYDSLVDRAMRSIVTKKTATSDRIMAEICRKDDDPPKIPYLHKFGGSGEY